MLKDDKSNAFEIDASDLLKTGVYPSKFPRRIPMWSSVNGFQFNEFGMQIKKQYGPELMDLGTAPIRGMTSIREYSTKVIYAGDLTSIHAYRLDDQTSQDVSLTTYSLLENSEATTWTDGGVTVWDGGLTTWDESINRAGRWSFESFGSWVFAANGVDKPEVKKNNVNFNVLHDDEVSGAVVTSGGTNYSVDDTITFTTSGSGINLTATVTAVDTGAVTAFEITNFGSAFADAEVLTAVEGDANFTATVTVPDAPFETVEIFKRQGPHLLAFNYTLAASGADDGDRSRFFAWCSADNPDEWIGSAVNTAGSLQIREANTGLKAAVQLGNNIAVYNENQMFLVSYLGPPNYFGYRVALELGGIGAASKHSIVSSGRLNFGYSKDGFFQTDGTNVLRIGRENGMDDYVRDNIATNEYEQVSGYHNSVESEVSWTLPLNSNKPTTEVYYNYTTRQWGTRTSIMTSFDDHGVFENPLGGDENGRVWEYGGTDLTHGEIIATSRPQDLGQPDRIKEINAIRLGKTGDDVTVRVGWSETIDVTPTWTETLVFDGTFTECYTRTAGRYLSLEFTAPNDASAYEITDLVIQGRYEGSR